MKSQFLATVALSVICYGDSITSAEEPRTLERLPAVSSDGPIVIYRKVYLNESLPEIGSRLYDKVDYELRLLQLTRDIRIVETELAQQRERLRIYDKFFGYQDAGFVTLQNARLDILKSEEQLKLLRQAKLLALRHRNDQIRYRELLIARGAALVQLAE